MNQWASVKAFFHQGNFWRTLGTVLSLALLLYLVASQGWDVFFQTLSKLPLKNFIAALLLIFASRLFVSLRWFILLRSANLRISISQCLRLVFTGLFASNFLPSTIGGDLMRAAGAINLRMDSAVVTASLVVDRLVGMAGMALLLPVGVLVITGSVSTAMLNPPAAYIFIGLVSVTRFRSLGDRLNRFGRSMLQSSMNWLKHPLSLGQAFLYTFAHMLSTFFSIALLLYGMDEPLSLLWIGGLWSVSYFFSLAPFSINGLGLQEVSIAYLFSHFGGVSMEVSLALAVLMRMLFLLSSLPGAVFLPGIIHPQPAKET